MTPPRDTDEELRRLAEAATPGSRFWHGCSLWASGGQATFKYKILHESSAECSLSDKKYMTAVTPSRVLGLLDRIKEQREALEEIYTIANFGVNHADQALSNVFDISNDALRRARELVDGGDK